MQDEKWLDARGLALQNIRVRGGRSFGIAALSALLALMLFLSSFWMLSLKNGLRSLSGRMGADLILVPEGYDSKISGAILRGEPNSFFFHTDVLEKIRENPAVEEAAPQLYLASLTAGCCSYPLQIIGLDFDSDFSVVPWLKASAKLPLAADEVLVGASVEGDYRHEIRLFGKTYRIKGKLAKTGMGFDTSVFMGMPEVRSLAREYEKLLNSPIGADDSLISSVMVKVKPGTDVDALRKSLQESWSGQGVYVLAAQNMMREVAGNVDRLLLYVYLLLGLLSLRGVSGALCPRRKKTGYPSPGRLGELASRRFGGKCRLPVCARRRHAVFAGFAECVGAPLSHTRRHSHSTAFPRRASHRGTARALQRRTFSSQAGESGI